MSDRDVTDILLFVSMLAMAWYFKTEIRKLRAEQQWKEIADATPTREELQNLAVPAPQEWLDEDERDGPAEQQERESKGVEP